MRITDTYTGLSALVEGALLLWVVSSRDPRLCRLRGSLAAYAIANALTVGLLGALIIYHGDVPAGEATLHFSNAYLHALPAFLAVVTLLLWRDLQLGQPRLRFVLGIAVIVGATFLLTPHGRTGTVLVAKIRAAYGVSNPIGWLLGIVVSILTLLALLCHAVV